MTSAALQETPGAKDDSSQSSPPSVTRNPPNLQKEIKDLQKAVEALQYHNTRLRTQRDKAITESDNQKTRAEQATAAAAAAATAAVPVGKQFTPLGPAYETFDALFRRVEGWAYTYARIPWQSLDLGHSETRRLIELCKQFVCDRNVAILNGPNKYLLVAAVVNSEVVKTLGEHCLNEYVSEYSNEMAILLGKVDGNNDNNSRTSGNDRARALDRRTALYNTIFSKPSAHEFMEDRSEKYVRNIMSKLQLLIALNLRQEAKNELLSIMHMGFRLGMGMLNQARTWRFAWASCTTRWQPHHMRYRDWTKMDNEERKDQSDHFVLLGVAPEVTEKEFFEGGKSRVNILHWKVALLYRTLHRPHPLPPKPSTQSLHPNASFPPSPL